MVLLSSIHHESFRKNFLVFFALSSILPLLIAIFACLRFVLPVLDPGQIGSLRYIFTGAVLAMLVPSVVGFILVSRWVMSIEIMAKEFKHKTAQIVGTPRAAKTDNELAVLHQSFNDLHDQLQSKMGQLNEFSKKLIDSNVKLKEMATTDELTSVYNRRYFDLRLIEEVGRSERYQQELSLIMLDFDDFKMYNDTHGHPTGDKLLRDMGAFLSQAVRKSDIVFRYGGDEFVVLVPGCDIRMAKQLADKLVSEVAQHPFEDLHGAVIGSVTVSCGVSRYAQDVDLFVAEADKHLYAAKSAGKNLVMAGLE
jgi:diguanylate cyclase (GGDEF)-like protein